VSASRRDGRAAAASAGGRGGTDAGTALGVVIAMFRRHYAVRLPDGTVLECVLKGRRTTPACGDQVRVARVAGGGAIESIEPRRNLVYRSDAFKEKLIAANVTLVVGVVAPDLPVDFELVDRWTVAAEAERCRFLLVANKSDHPSFPVLLARTAPYRRLGYDVLELSAVRDISPILPLLAGEHSVLVGQSGMGKSTILNAVTPAAAARVGTISTALASGRHTTTETSLHLLPDDPAGGWIVDAPGMKAFGLAHLDPGDIASAFVEIRPLLGQCRFRDCRHDREPGCAIREAVARGDVAPHRLALMHAMVAESRAARDPSR
jgi:ribosome biogenesis GTPase